MRTTTRGPVGLAFGLVGAVALGFALACTGDVAPPPPSPSPAPAPAPAPATDPAPTDGDEGAAADTDAEGTDAAAAGEASENGAAPGESWCCEYDGPLGRTQALLDSPKECTDEFGSQNAEFVKGDQCAPVCCKYAKDPADLGKGFNTETVAAGNCTMRKGTVEPDACAAKPRPSGPRPTPQPSRLVRPGSTAPPAPGGRKPTPAPGGRITRPR